MKQRCQRELNRRQLLCGLGAGASLLAAPAWAQDTWPNRPIRLILGFPPGGPTDIIARILGTRLGELFGQTIVVENKPGANAVVAGQLVARSPADGYTLLYNTSSFALSAALSPKLPYSPTKDFVGIALTAAAALVLMVHPALPVRTLPEFVAHLRNNPGKLSFASGGNGTITHVAPVQLLQHGGLSALHVPYKGSAPAMIDLVGGQVQFAVDAMSSALPFIRDGRVRAIAVTSKERLAVLPDVPTVSEAWMPGYEALAWQGLMAPAGTPAAIVARLNQAVNQVLGQPAVRASLAQQGTDPLGSTPERYEAYVRQEIERWTQVARTANIVLE